VEPRGEEVPGLGRHPVGPASRGESPGAAKLSAGPPTPVARGLGPRLLRRALPSSPGGLVLETTAADRIHSFEPAPGACTARAA